MVFDTAVLSNSSLKTVENLQVVAKIPNDRLMLKTDVPWCEVRPTHAGARFIKTIYCQEGKVAGWQHGKGQE